MILRACFVVILGNVFNFFNILKFIPFKVLERLKTLHKITIKYTLN